MFNPKGNIKMLFVLGAVILFPNVSYAQVPTFDPSNIANIVTRIQNLSGQLKQIQQAAKQVEKAKATIGDTVSNVGDQWASLKEGASFSSVTASLKDMKPEVPGSLSDIGFSESMIEEPTETKNFVQEEVLETAPGENKEEALEEVTVEDIAERRKIKEDILKEAATGAYAASLNVRNSASQVDTKMEAVQEAAANATTERDDLAALTQATTIMVEDIATLNTVTAAGLEVDAASAINGM